jgi:hypothetical protein
MSPAERARPCLVADGGAAGTRGEGRVVKAGASGPRLMPDRASRTQTWPESVEAADAPAYPNRCRAMGASKRPLRWRWCSTKGAGGLQAGSFGDTAVPPMAGSPDDSFKIAR